MYNKHNFSLVSCTNGFSMWHYEAGNDHLLDLAADGYFEDEAARLDPGSVIWCTARAATYLFVVAARDKLEPVRVRLMTSAPIL